MGASRQHPQFRRIVRQTITLTKKNFLIYWKTPISIILRALIFPIGVTLIFCLLRNIGATSYYGPDNPNYGIAASPSPIKSLNDAITSASENRIVFVRNGVADVDTTIAGIIAEIGSADHHVVDDPNDLFDLCQQTLAGRSDCFAAVMFESSNATTIEYSIALDSSYVTGSGYGDWSVGGSNKISDRILPLQWAVNSHLGGFSTSPVPQTQPRGGEPKRTSDYTNSGGGQGQWLYITSAFLAPVYILILIGIVYHLAIFVATERETQTSELMAAQKVSITPRILSTFFSFFVLYFPGILISSILQTQLLFTRTSDILLLFCTILAAMSIVTSSHFLASFFSKAQLAGLYSSTLVFALALVTLVIALAVAVPETTTIALAAVFPPITYVTLIGDVAFREYNFRGFSLAHNATNIPDQYGYMQKNQSMDGYLYVIFFILQIVVFAAATYGVEHGLWGVTRKYSTIEASNDVALRCTNLTKTYKGKRRWYFPCLRKSKAVKAVDSLSLEVKKGSVTFLLGPNGGGKTTTLKCVAGMTSMDAGSQLELNEASQVFGICPQNNVFWDNLTVYEHVKIWRELKTAAFEDFNNGYQDDDVVAECDLIEKTNAPAGTLSGGQMRKLQLAISFVGGSKVCCIDEASSGLDPLSRRNIWNIIQKGHARRSILVTTHFLDEADVLADHIAIVYKGKLVCEGAPTSLKARFGDNYVIRANDEEEAGSIIFKASNSADATRKIVELESTNKNQSYNVVFPTLEQVFLKVTDSKSSAIRQAGGDGMVEEGDAAAAVVVEEKDVDGEHVYPADIDLDVGHSVGFYRQVLALINKRYILLTQKAGWISYGINLIIPIIIAAALLKYVHKFKPYQTCAMNEVKLRNPLVDDTSSYGSYTPLTSYAPFKAGANPVIYIYSDSPAALLGPESEFSGEVQDELYISDIGPFTYGDYSFSSSPLNATAARNRTLSSRSFAASSDEMIKKLANISTSPNYYQTPQIAIFAPTPESAIFYYNTEQYESSLQKVMLGMDYLTNHIANSTTKSGSAKRLVSNLRTMRTAENDVDFYLMPLAILVALAFIASASISVIYPTFEKTNRVRALQYCNGVSPAALWVAYLLFDMHFIIIQSLIVWGLIFAGSVSKVWYSSTYLLGAFILFGMATYLGCYVLSLFLKKAAFAIAAGVHVLLVVIYLVSYVGADQVGGASKFSTFDSLQYGLGLSSPAANLLRALYIATNSYGVLCGKFGVADTSNPFAYVRYGGVYTNLILQILFLLAVLAIYEYGSADYIRRKIFHRGMPPQLQYLDDDIRSTGGEKKGKVSLTTSASSVDVLVVSQLTKYFKNLVAVENISFSIPPNSTLALLGGNGAGKSTVINMIRSLLKPNFGSITLDDINVLAEPHKARLHMGVCPQDDAIDNLTVRQTLAFYATVKGLSNIEGNVQNVMQALNITTFEHHSVRALSGGTRRKLSVAIALLGNPRILLLDEPSTGQDAGAKRILWRALKDVSNGRAILLTTHSMEEAEALANNVAIMGTKMLATGTLSSLQKSHGGAYMIRAVRSPNTTSEEVKQLLEARFENRVSNYMDGHGQVSFNLPHDMKALGSIMGVMEGLKAKVLSDYTINGPTLEEVFMNVAREAGAATGV